MSGPMDPERLALLEGIVLGMGVGNATANELVEELLDAHEHWQAEAERRRGELDDIATILNADILALADALDAMRGEQDRLARVVVCEAWDDANAISRVGAACYLCGLGLACTVDDVDRIFAGCRTPWAGAPEGEQP